MRELPTGTVTLLFTDIESSTRLLQRVGERYAGLLETCRSLLRAAFLEFGGFEVDTQGDAFFVAFARASDAGAHRLKDLHHPSQLFQLVTAGLPADFLPLRTLDSSPNNLPLQPTPFIGRQKEVDAVGQLLLREEVHLVTLTGPGGVGKTRLALQVAAEVSEHFTDGTWFVKCSLT